MRLAEGTGTAADRNAVIAAGLENEAVDASIPPTVEAVDEDDLAEEPIAESDPAPPVSAPDPSSEPSCVIATDPACFGGTVTQDEPTEPETEPTDPSSGPPPGTAAAVAISNCSSGHTARRFTVTYTQKGSLQHRYL